MPQAPIDSAAVIPHTRIMAIIIIVLVIAVVWAIASYRPKPPPLRDGSSGDGAYVPGMSDYSAPDHDHHHHHPGCGHDGGGYDAGGDSGDSGGGGDGGGSSGD